MGGVRWGRRSGAGCGPAMLRISLAGSGGAGLELGLRLPLGLGEVALDPELVPLLGDQLRDGGDLRWHLEGAAEGLGEGRQLRRQQTADARLSPGEWWKFPGASAPATPGLS